MFRAKRPLLWKAYLFTGARLSELRDLDVVDIDMEGLAVVFKDAKRKDRERVVPIHSAVVDIFRNWAGLRSSLPRDVGGAFRRDARRAGIKGVDLHCLRVTFITRLTKGGADLQVAQRLAGHANIMTTLQYYLKCVHPDVRSALERI
jgi:integrase